jgi:hypothetical protein
MLLKSGLEKWCLNYKSVIVSLKSTPIAIDISETDQTTYLQTFSRAFATLSENTTISSVCEEAFGLP